MAAFNEDKFIEQFKALQRSVHATAKEKGWYEPPHRTSIESLMLVVTEIAEAVEEIRNSSKPIYREGRKYEGMAVECADAIIRLMDLAEYEGWPVAEAIILKSEFNKSRPHRHGGKKL
jgi:NTP pyrophosphatase (non-canonical NTP hydrolase)